MCAGHKTTVCVCVNRDNAPSTKADDLERQEAERKLQELKRRRNDAESEEFEKMKQKQQDAEAELEELKRKREERRKILEEEEKQKKQELEEKKAKEQVKMDFTFRNLIYLFSRKTWRCRAKFDFDLIRLRAVYHEVNL